ncbi:hypothetical protein Pelo_8557 [Pelomyxa schiedti]|nr:hypothetical protein Pelo_8557 [Pelomyxa schiedti]
MQAKIMSRHNCKYWMVLTGHFPLRQILVTSLSLTLYQLSYWSLAANIFQILFTWDVDFGEIATKPEAGQVQSLPTLDLTPAGIRTVIDRLTYKCQFKCKYNKQQFNQEFKTTSPIHLSSQTVS